MTLAERIASIAKPIIKSLEFLAPLADLGVRLLAAKVFWDSALTKVNLDLSWPFMHMNPSTLQLFATVYHVPVLSPAVAAYLGATVEFTFPIFLALGLGGRLAAAVLFVFNIVAVASYPGLEEFGIAQHELYGALLLLSLLRGPGAISFDHFLRRRWMK